MAQTSDELKKDIDRTREEMGDTVEALAYKVDVPTRTKEWLGEKKEAVVSRVGGAPAKVGELAPDGQEVKQRVGRMRDTAERNPLGLAIAGAAAGFIAGLLTPSTRVEDERLGPFADELKSTAADAGREAVDRGKTVVEEAGQAAMETARETGREEGGKLAAHLEERAREAVQGDEPQTHQMQRPTKTP